jgi:hypothetical protein
MTYALLVNSTNWYEQEADPLGHIEWPYSHMREVLLSVQYLCLPHPHLGFWDVDSERKAQELVEKIKAKRRIFEVLETENTLELKEAA